MDLTTWFKICIWPHKTRILDTMNEYSFDETSSSAETVPQNTTSIAFHSYFLLWELRAHPYCTHKYFVPWLFIQVSSKWPLGTRKYPDSVHTLQHMHTNIDPILNRFDKVARVLRFTVEVTGLFFSFSPRPVYSGLTDCHFVQLSLFGPCMQPKALFTDAWQVQCIHIQWLLQEKIWFFCIFH